jgi:alpha-galactosidase
MYTVVAGREGAQEYYNSLFELYASWGVDFVKIDDLSRPYHQGEIEMIRRAIDSCGRPIVLSTSPGATPLESSEHVMAHANMWRMVDDFWDNWPQLKPQFDFCESWYPYIGKGHWPDADMLPLGRIGIRAERGDERMSGFTRDEQYTVMTLFTIFRSPLMFGGDLPSNDEFTLSLITNSEVLRVNQTSENNRPLFRRGDLIGWTADDPASGDKYLALFNATDQLPIDLEKSFWKSDLITEATTGHSIDIDVDITGKKKLYLVTYDHEPSAQRSMVNWIDPEISGKAGTVSLSETEWVRASAGRGMPVRNSNFRNGKLTVNDVEYSSGIGTRGVSVIEFDLPDGYTRFRAKAGIDKASLSQPGGSPSARFSLYSVDPVGDIPADSVRIAVNLREMGIAGKVTITDLWSGEVAGTFRKEFAPYIRRHGAGLYRVTQLK